MNRRPRFSHPPGKIAWTGYQDHQTETRDDARPRVIVHVLTTAAPAQDIAAPPVIHRDPAAAGRSPASHVVDAGYVTP